MALSFNSDLGKPHANPMGGGASKARDRGPGFEKFKAEYERDVLADRKGMRITGGRLTGKTPAMRDREAEQAWDSMGQGERDQHHAEAQQIRDTNAGVQPAAAAAPTGVPVRQMLQPAPATPEADKGNTFAPKIDAPAPGGIRMAPPSPEGGAAPALPGKGDVMRTSTPVAGGGFSAVKPRLSSQTAPGTATKSGTDRVISQSAKDTPFGIVESDNGVVGGPSVPVRTLTGPQQNRRLPMGVRMRAFNDATTAAAWRATGNVNKRDVINAGSGQTFGKVMASTGAPTTAEGKLVNPGADMAAGMNFTKPDGGVLHYTRPNAGRGGPAPLKLTGATRAVGTSISMNDGSNTGADVRVNRGGGRTDIYDLGAQLGGTGAYRGSVTDKGGVRQVTNATGKVVGTAKRETTDPAMDVRQTELATIAERDKARAAATRPAGTGVMS